MLLSCLVWSSLHLILTHPITLSHPIILHPTYPSLLTLFPTTLQPSHSIFPLHPMPSHPFHFTYPITPHFLFFLSHPTLSHPTLCHHITSIPFHSPHPPTCLFPPMPSHLFHRPPPHPHLLWTSMPAIPRWRMPGARAH